MPAPRTVKTLDTHPSGGGGHHHHLLLVEDSAGDARLIEEIVREAALGWTLTHVTRVRDAIAILANTHVDCVLLDLAVLDASGMEAVRQITDADTTRPIVVLTHREADHAAEQALAQGAQDYLPKRGLDAPLLTRAVRYAIERKAAELRMLHQSLHDPLTGLPNRTLFDDRLRLALSERVRPIAVLFVDLDDFKAVNDSLGHQAGDEVLKATAHRLSSVMRGGDTVARFAGDEFTVLCPHLPSIGEAKVIAERIRAVLAEPVHLAGRDHIVTGSVGLAVSTAHDDDATTLLSQADAALYRAKALGKNRCVSFDDSLRVQAMSRLTMTRQLRTALEREEFHLVYQPEIELRTGGLHTLEALIRWTHPSRGLLTPASFIDLAESGGLIVPIGSWVLHTATARHLTRYPQDKAGPARTLPRLAVNISAVQLAHPSLPDTVASALDASGLDPALLDLEITETALLDKGGLADALTALRGLGVGIVIDDFGTGYSSLNYLKLLPATAVKIDLSFVAGIGNNPVDEAIIAAVIAVAHASGIMTIAEGVETGAQRDHLRALGCDLAQGYLYGLPS